MGQIPASQRVAVSLFRWLESYLRNQCVRTGNLTKPLKGSRTVHRHAQKLSLNFSLSPQTLSLITVGDAVRQLFEEEKVIICPEASFSG
jgi:hypothetical protein